MNKPVHITGQSRVDTWRTAERMPQTNRSRVIHQPVQVQGKTRIDTWQSLEPRRRAHSATEVRTLQPPA